MTDDFDPRTINWVDTPAQVEALARAIETPGTLCVFDCETTDLNPLLRHSRMSMASWTLVRLNRRLEAVGEPTNYVMGLSHPHSPFCTTWRPQLRRLAEAMVAGGKVCGQNIPFDSRWTYAATGVDLSPAMVWDTALSSHLLDENAEASLKPRAQATFGVPRWDDCDFNAIGIEQRKIAKKLGIPWETLPAVLSERVPYYQLGVYAARDTYWTWRLMERHLAELGRSASAREELLEIRDREAVQYLRLGDYQHAVMIPALRVISRMQQRGMAMDKAWCEAQIEELADVSIEAFQALEEMRDDALDAVSRTADLEPDLAKTPNYEGSSGYFSAWAELMVRAKQLRVGATTATGKASWTKEVLGRQAAKGSVPAQRVLDYRQSTKQAQFIRSWDELVAADGAMHTTYNYYRTVTGRLSSKEPNMQQVTKALRPAFVAREGYVLVDADYSQIEMRGAAHVSGCQLMIDAFNRGDDTHKMMAASIAGIPLDKVTKEQRQGAKAANFGFLYGMGARKFVDYALDTYDVVFTEDEAIVVRQAFFSMWDGIAQWHQRTVAKAERDGFVVSPLGRVRRLPLIFSDDEYVRSEAGRQAINSPVQSFASDLTLLATVEIDRHPDIHPLALVHDSIVCEVPVKQAERLALHIAEVMEGIGEQTRKLGCTLTVPLVADVAIGRAWSTGIPLERTTA